MFHFQALSLQFLCYSSWQACFAQLQRKLFKDTKNWRRRYCLGKEWTKRNPSGFLPFCWHHSLLIQKMTLFKPSVATFHFLFWRISALGGFSPFLFLLLYSPAPLWVCTCLGNHSEPATSFVWYFSSS